MSTVTPFWSGPAFLGRKPNGIEVEQGDRILVAHRQDVDPDEIAKALSEQPIKITVMGVTRMRKKKMRILYAAPWGVQVKIQRSRYVATGLRDTWQPVSGVHRSLVLTRYPREAVHWFPAADLDEAARDLVRNAIFINIGKIVNERVTLRIQASDKWTVLRSEIDIDATGESAQVPAAMPGIRENHDAMPDAVSSATLRFDQLTQLAAHYHDVLSGFPTELAGDAAIRTLSQDQIVRFLAIERRIGRQHAALEDSLNVLDYD